MNRSPLYTLAYSVIGESSKVVTAAFNDYQALLSTLVGLAAQRVSFVWTASCLGREFSDADIDQTNHTVSLWLDVIANPPSTEADEFPHEIPF